MQEQIYNFFKHHDITKGLSDDELKKFSALVEIETFDKNVFLVEEGDLSRELYFILDGEVSLLKWDEEKKYQLDIARLGKSDMFGEMSFLDAAPRSSAVKTKVPTILLKISPSIVNATNPETKSIFHTMVQNIAEININRLRSTNQNYVKSLRAQIDALELRNGFGYMFVMLIILFGLNNVVQIALINFGVDPTNHLVTWLYAFIFLGPLLLLNIKFKYSPRFLGVTTLKWKESLLGGFLAGGVAVALAAIGYLIYEFTHPTAKSLIYIIQHPLKKITLFSITEYCVLSYIQEFIARGFGQTSLQKFLDDTKGIRTVFLVSFLFGVFHLFRGLEAGFIVFLGSIPMGLLFLHYKNLLASALFHVIIGTIGVKYLGAV